MRLPTASQERSFFWKWVFAFLGRQYHIEFGGQDFYIDLLIVDYSLGGIVTSIAVSSYRPNVLPQELASELPKPNEMSAKLVEIMAEAEGDEA